MAELKLCSGLIEESEFLRKDREYECVKWMSISKAYAAISNILYMETLMPWQVEGLQLAQECLKEYVSFIDLLTDNLLIKKEVSDGNLWFTAVTGFF